MFADKFAFSLVERNNVYSKKGTEWALNVSFIKEGRDDIWTVKTYDKKPKDEVVRNDISTCIRAMMIFHASLKINGFNIECKYNDEIVR